MSAPVGSSAPARGRFRFFRSGRASSTTTLTGTSRFWSGLLANGVPILFLLAWWYGSTQVPEYVIPDPLDVFRRTADLLGMDSAYFADTVASFVRVGISVLIAMLLGSVIAVTAKYVAVLELLLMERLLPFLNAFPGIGWAIAALYWFQISNFTAIFVEVLIILPFTMITVWEGLKALDSEMLEMARSFTRSRWRLVVKVVLPHLAPYLFSSLRISYGVAWKVAIVAELFGAPSGLGYLLNLSRERFDSVTLFATILTLILIVYVVDKLILQPLESSLLRYRKVSVARKS